MLTFFLGTYVGAILAAAAVIRIRKAWGAVYEYRGLEWLAVPYFLALGAWRARPSHEPSRGPDHA